MAGSHTGPRVLITHRLNRLGGFSGRLTVMLIALLLPAVVFAQDLHFSQFYETPLLRNPSLAGIFNGDIRIQGVYRDQWNSFTNAYRSGSLNAEYKMPVGKSHDYFTTGAQLLFDKAGTAGLTTTRFLPVINYHKSLSDIKPLYLSLGFMGGLVQKSIDRSKITTNNQYDGAAYNPSLADGETFTTPNYSYFDGSFGVSLNSGFGADQKNSFYAGVAWHHFNRPRHSFYRSATEALNPKIVFSAGLNFNVDEYTSFIIQADQSVQGSFRETIGGVLYAYRLGEPENVTYTLHGGAFLRWKDAFIPVIRIDYQALSVGLSYDINISPLKTVSMGRGGFELSVAWTGFLDRENSARDKVLCPRF